MPFEGEIVMNIKVRCPRCLTVPKSNFRLCDRDKCGNTFDVFLTHGVCPVCQTTFLQLVCEICHEFSPVFAWFDDGKPPMTAEEMDRWNDSLWEEIKERSVEAKKTISISGN
jgi:hypothetical protein